MFWTHTIFAEDSNYSEIPHSDQTISTEESGKVSGIEELIPLEAPADISEEEKIRVIPVIDVSALGSFSDVDQAGSTYGFDINGLFSPVIKLDDSNYLIPTYSGSFSEIRQVVTEDEGGHLTDIVSHHNASVEYKHIAGPQIIYRVKGLGRFHRVKEEDIDWGDGLYDYWDAGGGGSVEYFFINDTDMKSSVTLGGEVYHRAYPNFQSLIALAAVTSAEESEKDYWGYRPVLRYNFKRKGKSLKILYSPVFKDYDDKRVIAPNGVLQSDKREDGFHYGEIEWTHLPESWPVGYGFKTTAEFNDSNQNYYDSNNTPLALGDDVYTSDYFSYRSVALNPSLIVPLRMKNKRTVILVFGYEYLIKNYENRKARTSAGAYRASSQEDHSHSAKFQGQYPLTDSLSLITQAQYAMVDSNQNFETFYRYTYDMLYCAAGLRWKY